MPKQQPPSSTVRRSNLADFVDSFGTVMVQKCEACVKNRRVCKVHVRSGKCSECLRRNQRCNVRVTESEFKRLASEKEKLEARIKESREAQDAAIRLHEQALEELRTHRAREQRLRLQMDLLERRAEEAIAVESRELEELERGEVMEFPESGPSLALSPSTWGAFEGLPLDYWEPLDVSLLVAGGTGSGVDGSS